MQATTFTWEVLVKCGDPSVAAVGATFSSETTKNGWFGMPDNCAIDSQGRLWISTDGNNAKATGRADGSVGAWKPKARCAARPSTSSAFRSAREMCGPFFTPNDETLFLAVQHPGEAEEGAPVELRQSDDPLAGLQGRHAAAPVRARRHEDRAAARSPDRPGRLSSETDEGAPAAPSFIHAER